MPFLEPAGMALVERTNHHCGMSKLAAIDRIRRPHYIRQWRKFRGLTQEQLEGRIEKKGGTLSKLENYKIDYTQEHLESLAHALRCTPRDLLAPPPNELDNFRKACLEAEAMGTPDQLESVARVIMAMVKAA